MSDTLTGHQKKVLRWHEFKREILEETHICTTDCKYYHKCPLAVSDIKGKEHDCAVKKLSDEDLNRFLTLFVFEQEALKDEAFRVLYNIGKTLNTKSDAREMQMYLDNILKVVRTFRIDVVNSTGLDEPITVRLGDYGTDIQDQVDVANKAWKDEGLVLMEDPESLVHSATVVEKFMTPPSQTSELRKRAVFVKKEELVRVKI